MVISSPQLARVRQCPRRHRMSPNLAWKLRPALAALALNLLGPPALAEPATSSTNPTCPVAAAWTVPDADRPHTATTPAVITEAAKRDVVLLGENHDQEDHHRWELQTLAALHAQRSDMVIGFEMFPRRVQPALDRWVAGDLTVPQFLQQSDWSEVWDLPPEYYLPLFQFARINRIPMVALNVDEKLVKSVTASGWDAIPDRDREGVSRPAPPSKAYRDYLLGIYRAHPAGERKEGTETPATDPAFARFVEAQTTWDRAMAEALARYAVPSPEGRKPLVVGIMGAGHVRFGYGVAHQLRALGVKSISMLLPVSFDFNCAELRPGLADAVFALPKMVAPAPQGPRLGVRLEETAKGLQIADITPGSLAERTGLKTGDRFLEIAGREVKKMAPVIAAIRQQPAGTWLPIRIQRGGDTLDLVIKFPANA
jgi:uncharacterized iron-regulated protein